MDGRDPSSMSRPPARNRRLPLKAALDAIAGGSSAARALPRQGLTASHRRPSSGAGDLPPSASQASNPLPTMDEFSTLSPGYFTNLLNREHDNLFMLDDNIESENEIMDSAPQADLNSQSKAKGRSKNFNEAEDILLISAYLKISKDAIVGRDQKDGRFWERVEKCYHDNKTFESDRNWSSLKHRWSSTIQKEVSIFQGFVDVIERKNQSGMTMTDKLAEANSMFQQLKGKAFSLIHAWNILKHEPKWAEEKISKEDNGNGEGAPNQDRPLGRKAEKEKAKGKKRSGDEPDPFIEEVKKMRESREQIERDRKERDDRFIELDKKKLDMEQDQHDKVIMTTDTSSMDDQSCRYYFPGSDTKRKINYVFT